MTTTTLSFAPARHSLTIPTRLRRRAFGGGYCVPEIRRTRNGWQLYDGYVLAQGTACEVVADVRQRINRAKDAEGKDAAYLAWAELCEQMATQAKAIRTARDLLADETTRKLVRKAVIEGKAWTADLDYYAVRKVQREAMAIVANRRQRVADRQAAEAARNAPAGRIARQATPQGIALRLTDGSKHSKTWIKHQLLRPEVRKHLSAEQLWQVVDRVKLGRRQLAELVRERMAAGDTSDALVRRIISLVGTTDEQTEADLEALECDRSFSGKQGRNHMLQETFVHRIEFREDFSAGLITMGDYKSWGSSRYGGPDSSYGSRRAMSFRCYLIVRDSTRGSAHLLRVPPKFGNERTNFFCSFLSEALPSGYRTQEQYEAGKRRASESRIQAAIAWTFGQEANEYRPDVEA